MMLLLASPTPRCAVGFSLATTAASFADGAALGVSYTQMLCCGLLWQRQQLHLLMMLLLASPTPRCAVGFSLATTAASFADGAALGVSYTQMRCGLLWQRQHLHLLMLLLPASPTPTCAVDFSGNGSSFICRCCCSRRLPHPHALWTSLATTTSLFADAAAPGVSYTQMRCGFLWQRQHLHLLLLLPASPTPRCAGTSPATIAASFAAAALGVS